MNDYQIMSRRPISFKISGLNRDLMEFIPGIRSDGSDFAQEEISIGGKTFLVIKVDYEIVTDVLLRGFPKFLYMTLTLQEVFLGMQIER